MPLFKPKKPKVTLQQMLAARPVRLVDVQPVDGADGKSRLTVPLRPAGLAKWILRVPEGATKTFELDPLGVMVWTSADGKTSVQQIIRRLARQYNLNVREAQVATLEFLRVLTRKGLVGMQVRERRDKTDGGKGTSLPPPSSI